MLQNVMEGFRFGWILWNDQRIYAYCWI